MPDSSKSVALKSGLQKKKVKFFFRAFVNANSVKQTKSAGKKNPQLCHT